jgi:hypothetical protein
MIAPKNGRHVVSLCNEVYAERARQDTRRRSGKGAGMNEDEIRDAARSVIDFMLDMYDGDEVRDILRDEGVEPTYAEFQQIIDALYAARVTVMWDE